MVLDSPNKEERIKGKIAHIELRNDCPTVPIIFTTRNAAITIDNYLPEHIQATVINDHPGFAVFSSVYYPGWICMVNKKRAPLSLFEQTFPAVPLPEGVNKIEFIYNSQTFLWGCITTGITFVALILYFLRKRLHDHGKYIVQ